MELHEVTRRAGYRGRAPASGRNELGEIGSGKRLIGDRVSDTQQDGQLQISTCLAETGIYQGRH